MSEPRGVGLKDAPLSLEDDSKRKSKSAKSSSSNASANNSTRSSSKTTSAVVASNNTTTQNSELILETLKQIQQGQISSEAKVDGLLERVKALEEYEPMYDMADNVDPHYEEFAENQDPCGGLEDGEIDKHSSPKKSDSGRFANMAKRFKGKECTDKPVDSGLADNINDVFKNGMDEDHYSQMIKDENIMRPDNCEALVTVKCNKMIWDLCQTSTKFVDKRLQNAETSLIKGAILVTKAVDNLVRLESAARERGIELSSSIDQCNDALSLFGHSNRQLNMSRRDIIRPELRTEYSHLCNPSVPFTKELFGDDLSKTAKEVEDSVKMGHRLQSGYPMRSRGTPRGFRGRGRARFAPYKPRGAYGGGSSYGADPKNQSRRGGFRGAPRR